MTDRVGQQLGNYHLMRLLGRGGQAEVYLGEHRYLKSFAALKVLHASLDTRLSEQFLAEAQTLAHLVHPAIVRVLDFTIEQNIPVLIMDYSPAGTMRQRYPVGSCLPLTVVVSAVSQVASALHYAHSNHVIHRDVKPENLLLGPHDEVLLSDFGLSVFAPSPELLSTQAMAGTLPYMAPEQLQGHPCFASDQYSLAIVAYEWLTGRRPFTGSQWQLIQQQLEAAPPPLRALNPSVSEAVEAVVRHALAKDPQERYVSVQDFARALTRASQQAESTPAEDSQQTRPLPSLLPPLADSSGELLTPSSQQDQTTSPTFTQAPTLTRRTPAPSSPEQAKTQQVSPASSLTSPNQQDRISLLKIRPKYLQHTQRRYASITLPLGPLEGFSLQAVFQPLTLRRDPKAAEDREREERRLLLGEPRLAENEPIVQAENGEEALTKSPQRRMVILGGPGTGKTTLLQSLMNDRIQQAQADLTAPLPLFISLPDLARSDQTLQEYLVRLTKEVGIPDRSADFLWKTIEDGQAFVCLDSLDEVTPRERPGVIRLINELASSPGNTWVVGSRFTDYKGGQFKRGQFAEWELQPMNHDVRQLLAQRLLPELQRLLPAKGRPSEDEPLVFVRTLESHPQAAAWVENPLLFSLAAAVFARTGALPSSRAALYQQVTDAIFETREQDPTRRKMVRRVVADLALELYRTKGRTFTREDIVLLLPAVRQRQLENWSTEEMSNAIITSGILDVVAQETYGFRHQTFQEYLAALALAQRLVSQDTALRGEGWAFAWSKRTYSRWTEILRLMVGVLVQNLRKEGARQAKQWLLALVAQRTAPEGDIANLGLTLALESLAEVAETKTGNWRAEQGEKAEEEVVMAWVAAVFSNSGDYYDPRRFLAPQRQDRLHFLTDKVIHCSDHAAKMAVEQLITKLSAENWQRRETAVKALQRVRERVPVEPVLACLHDENSGVVRSAIVELLGNLGERVPVDALLSTLSDENSGVRSSAEKMLLQNRERIPAARLMPLLHSEDWRTRTSAAKVLAQLGVRVPVEPFLADLNEPDWERRAMAVAVLGVLGADAPIEALFAAIAADQKSRRYILAASAQRRALENVSAYVPLERLVDALQNSNPYIREAALTVLEYRETHPVMPSGSTTLPVHPGDTAVNAEGRHTSRESDMHTLVNLILPMLRNNDREAARALVGLSRSVPVPIEPLVAALENEDGTVRGSAAEALGNVRVGVPVEPLLKALGDEDEYTRKAAAWALRKMGRRPPEEFLRGGIGRQLTWMQATAAQLLCNMSEHVPIKVFEDMLTHENPQMRARAAKTLGQCSDRAHVEPLVVALQDEDMRVRVAAAEALGKFGERTPLEPLVSMLTEEVLREEGARTPGALGEGVWLASSPYGQRMIALRTLHDLGERVSLEPFLEALGDERTSVRAAAANVLGELGPPTPVEPLLAALHDPEPLVRRWAAWALGKLRKPAVIEPLLAALQDERDEVRSAASGALAQLAEDVPVESLLALLGEGDEKIGIAVWQVIANLGKPLPVEMLADALDHPDEQVRLAAIKVIGEMREATLVERLWNSLNHMQGSLVQPVTNAFQALHPCQGFTHDFRVEYVYSGSDDRNIYSVTLEALSQLAEHVPIESLRQAIKSKQWWVRQAAVIILGQLKEQASVDALLTSLDDNDWRVRAAAVRALTGLGVHAPLERLFTLLREGDINERLEAALALRAIGGPIPRETLLAVLDDVQNDMQIPTRRAALMALRILEGPVPIEPLVATLGDSDYRERDAAMATLHQRHPEALLTVVPEAIAIVQGGESGNVLGSMEQGVIAEAIGNLGYDSPTLLEKLTQLLDWPYWEVRMKAAQALGKIRRNVPDAAIRRLLELRHDSRSRRVCVAANDALAEILSLETGIEDD